MSDYRSLLLNSYKKREYYDYNGLFYVYETLWIRFVLMNSQIFSNLNLCSNAQPQSFKKYKLFKNVYKINYIENGWSDSYPCGAFCSVPAVIILLPPLMPLWSLVMIDTRIIIIISKLSFVINFMFAITWKY